MKPAKESVLFKNWVIHDRNMNITSMVRFVAKDKNDNFILAISRAYKSVDDNMFNRKLGRYWAEVRMNTYLDDSRRKFLKASYSKRTPVLVTTNIRRDVASRSHSKAVVFALGEENQLNSHELEIWTNTILPCIEAELGFSF